MQDKHWLDSLKVGDEVCYHSRYHGYTFETIEKITPTKQIKTSRNTFKDGYCRGGSAWEGGKILIPITQQILDKVRKRKLHNTLNEFRFDKLNLEQLEKIYSVVEEFELARSAPKTTEQPNEVAAESEVFGSDCNGDHCQ